MDAADRFRPVSMRPGYQTRHLQGQVVEKFWIENGLAQFHFDFRNSDGDREAAIVTREYTELQETEIAGGRWITDPWGFFHARLQAIMSREIENA